MAKRAKVRQPGVMQRCMTGLPHLLGAVISEFSLANASLYRYHYNT
jgi:hypothetical protein